MSEFLGRVAGGIAIFGFFALAGALLLPVFLKQRR
jgi:hypothetical protein